jgi:hypothetical protein
MARIQLGAPATGLRGTIGGITYSENGSGVYAKAWAQGPKKRTQAQQWLRSILSMGGGLWASLSGADRTAWKNFAKAPTEIDKDPWGIQYFLSGWQWFIRAQMRRVAVGLGPSATPPSAPAPTVVHYPALDIFAPTFGTSTISWAHDDFAPTESVVLDLVFVRTPTLDEASHGFRQVLAKYEPGADSEDIQAQLESIFGLFGAGWTAHARIFRQHEFGDRSIVTPLSTVVHT